MRLAPATAAPRSGVHVVFLLDLLPACTHPWHNHHRVLNHLVPLNQPFFSQSSGSDWAPRSCCPATSFHLPSKADLFSSLYLCSIYGFPPFLVSPFVLQLYSDHGVSKSDSVSQGVLIKQNTALTQKRTMVLKYGDAGAPPLPLL